VFTQDRWIRFDDARVLCPQTAVIETEVEVTGDTAAGLTPAG